MKTILLISLLTSTAQAAPRALEEAAAQAQAAAGARTPEEAVGTGGVVWDASTKKKERVEVRGARGGKKPAALTHPLAAPLPELPAQPSIKEERERRQKQKAPGKFLRSVGYGLAGFAFGVLTGWLLGAAAAGAFVWKAPNPSIQKWKYALIVPAVVIGAVAGEIAFPFILGGIFMRGEPYPAAGIKGRQGEWDD